MQLLTWFIENFVNVLFSFRQRFFLYLFFFLLYISLLFLFSFCPLFLFSFFLHYLFFMYDKIPQFFSKLFFSSYKCFSINKFFFPFLQALLFLLYIFSFLCFSLSLSHGSLNLNIELEEYSSLLNL